MGQGFLIVEASRSHSVTHTITHSVGLLWTSDQPVAQTSTWQHPNSQQRDIHASARLEPTIPASERPQIHAIDHADTGMLPGHTAVYPFLPHTRWTGIWCRLAVLLVTPELLLSVFQHHSCNSNITQLTASLCPAVACLLRWCSLVIILSPNSEFVFRYRNCNIEIDAVWVKVVHLHTYDKFNDKIVLTFYTRWRSAIL
jgi:hypothetical protein